MREGSPSHAETLVQRSVDRLGRPLVYKRFAVAQGGDRVRGRGKDVIDIELKVDLSRSRAFYEDAVKHTPGGAPDNKGWVGDLFYLERAEGCRLTDLDGNEYIDYHAAAGPIILGHSDRELNEAVIDTVENRGVEYAQPHSLEVELAKKLKEIIPNADMVAFGNAGTDTLQYAMRMARAYTGRPKVVKFGGGYRAWSDSQVGDEAARKLSLADTSGVLPAVLENNIVLPYNDLDALTTFLEGQHGEVACVIVEPIIHGQALLPKPGFLEGLQQLCASYDIALVIDEIITGFRHDLGGLQRKWGIDADIGLYGKSMANGYIISAVTGKERYMTAIDPADPAHLSGTYNGNPLSVTAALKTIEILSRPGFYDRLYAKGETLRQGITSVIDELGLDAVCVGYGSAWGVWFDKTPPESHEDAARYNATGGKEKSSAYVRHMLNNGVFVQPSRPAKAYLYAAHSDDDVQHTIDATADFLKDHQAALR